MKEDENYLLDFNSTDSDIDFIIDRPTIYEIDEKSLLTAKAVNLDDVKNKPWDMPGADINDYFNYGFTEKTYKLFCSMENNRQNFVKQNSSNTFNRSSNQSYSKNFNNQPNQNYTKNYNTSDKDYNKRNYNDGYKKNYNDSYKKNYYNDNNKKQFDQNDKVKRGRRF
ncbi:FIP1 [Hepatospora eriocheir]|uniref:FIP1 n=1 Tax=Hepatospora eriocheir TaxID=1081669 RepID=A0A1X0QIE4_9MICR|nr:FIP1 [Hepatospora eriocheir]ORD99516.1 FIP1 [Hepatospora eriocheir]